MKDVKYHNYTEKEALEYTSKLMDFGVTLIVYAALNEVLNAYILLRRSKLFRGIAKRRANETLRMRDRKVKELKDSVMHKGFTACYWDAIIDVCEEDVARFRAEIKSILDFYMVEDSDLYAQAETTRVLLEAAKIHFEEVIKESTNKFRSIDMEGMKNLNLFNVFHEFYIDGIYREWNAVCDVIYGNKSKDINLSNDKTSAAFNVMAEKFAKGTYIDSCLEAAKAEYPEYSEVKVVIEDD